MFIWNEITGAGKIERGGGRERERWDKNQKKNGEIDGAITKRDKK